MARPKRGPKPLEWALKRVASMNSISDNLDLGNGLTLQDYRREVGTLETTLESYNSTLSLAAELLDRVRSQEKLVRDWNERMLAGVASKYGKDSVEYEKAGGKRKSQRKRPERKPKATAQKTEPKAEPTKTETSANGSQPKA